MRISNPLHFTEQHRFLVCRDFSLSPIDQQMLATVYQPLVGSDAYGLYMLLFHQLPADQTGYSRPEQQRKLFLSIGLEPSDRGRAQLALLASRLEAVGLLESWRNGLAVNDEMIYVYRLFAPLSPVEFFRTQHLVLLLRDKVGQHMAEALRQSFYTDEPMEVRAEHLASSEDLSVPFYELFQLNPRSLDDSWERQMAKPALSFPESVKNENEAYKFDYADIITRFPRQSKNRGFVENLKYEPEQLAALNYVAIKYDLTLSELCRLLDEDGVFTANGELSLETLQHRANLTFRQDIHREEARIKALSRASLSKREQKVARVEPVDVDPAYYVDVPDMLRDEYDKESYNRLLRNSPYTVVLRLFFPGTIPQHVLNVFENLDLNYKLKEEVINVMIHFLKVHRLSWNKNYIDSIAADMLGKQIERYEQAVAYFRTSTMRRKASGFEAPGKAPRSRFERKKPDIPIIDLSAHSESDEPLTDEELQEIEKIVKELDGS